MRTPSIAIDANVRQYGKLVVIAGHVYNSMLANSHFPDPTPSLSELESATTAVLQAQGVYGQQGNRGSHVDYVDLKSKTRRLHLLLKALGQWVLSSAIIQSGNDNSLRSAILSTSGFRVTGERIRHNRLEAVQSFCNYISPALNRNQCKLKWSKPLNTSSPRDVKMNSVYFSTSPDFSTAKQIASTYKKEYIFTNNSLEMITGHFWIVPHNARGAGAVSNMLTAQILGK